MDSISLRMDLARYVTDARLIDHLVAKIEREHAASIREIRAAGKGNPAASERQSYEDSMEEASGKLQTAIAVARSGGDPETPERLIWRMSAWTSQPHAKGGNSDLWQPEDITNRITNRDPCPRCGVRADIGCKHQRTNA